jgi:thioredoxin reductase (NADPH)
MLKPSSTTIAVSPPIDVFGARPLLVVGLCAAWCNTCGAFEAAFTALAARHDDATFAWLDIEDDADIAGDIDVENFPTIAVFRDARLVLFGTSLPHAAVVSRLLDSLDATSRTVDVAPAVAALAERLARLDPDRAVRVLRGR